MASNEAREKLRSFLKEGVENSKDPHWIKMREYEAKRRKRREKVKKRFGLSS